MNHFKTAIAAIVGIALAGIATTTASAQNTKQGYATVVRVEGNVTYSLGKGQPEYPLVAGKYLAPARSFLRRTTVWWTWFWASQWICRRPNGLRIAFHPRLIQLFADMSPTSLPRTRTASA